MINHYFDVDGVYTHSAAANPGSAPPRNALRVAPPPLPEDAPGSIAYVRVRNAAGDGWELVASDTPDPAPPERPEPPDGNGGPLLYLTRSGTYHSQGCAYTTAVGEWLHPAAIAVANAKAKPCGRCNPPPLESGTDGADAGSTPQPTGA